MRDQRPTPTATRCHRRETPAACIARVVEEACNHGRLDILDTVLPLRATANGPAWAHLPDLLVAFRDAVPDARWTIVAQISQGETAATRLEVVGNFSGPLLGLAPPGRPATLTGVAISRFVGGRLEDLWLQADLLGLLEHLGILPPLALAPLVTMARVLHAGGVLADRPTP